MEKKWNQRDFSARLLAAAGNLDQKEASPTGTNQSHDTLEAYRASAAVLSSFDPTELEPYAIGTTKGSDYALIRGDSTELLQKTDQSNWTLNPEIRGKTLRKLIRENLLKDVVHSVQSPDDDPFNSVLKKITESGNNPLQLEDLSSDELPAALQVAKLTGSSLLGSLPSLETILQRLGRDRLLEPFHHLTRGSFVGREDDLGTLRSYVGVIDPKSVQGQSSEMYDGVKDITGFDQQTPLMIHGPGGMGKSTLIARFILEHADLPADKRFPFAYLDFDRPGITAREPLTLLSEILTQLAAQYPAISERCIELKNELRLFESWAVENNPQEQVIKGLESYSSERTLSSSGEERSHFLRQTRELFEEIAKKKQPLLLILDTFEEVQYHNRPDIRELFDFLDRLQEAIPRLRVVISGRTLETGLAVTLRELELKPINESAILELLQQHGIPEKLATVMAQHLGGNPLTLRLAIKVYENETDNGSEIKDLTAFFESINKELIQGQLYRRILQHISDERARRVAHPGLILRRITPELILKVLAGPCDLEIGNLAEANDLFDCLAREDALVTRESERSLIHRSDVRRIMIDLLRRDKPEQVGKIHQKAVEYYRNTPDRISRAEFLYHLSFLKETTNANLSEHWQTDLADLLQPAIPEVPEHLRSHLEALVADREQSGEIESADPDSEWETEVHDKAQRLLGHGQYEDALELLRSRPDRRFCSRLYFPEVIALTRLDQLDEARAVGERFLSEAEESDNRPFIAEILSMLGSIARRQDNTDEALIFFQRSSVMAKSLGFTRLAIHSNLLAVECARDSGQSPMERILAEELTEMVTLASPKDIAADPMMYREALDIVGEVDDKIASKIDRILEGVGAKTATRSGGKTSRRLRGKQKQALEVILGDLFVKTEDLEHFLRDRLQIGARGLSGGGTSKSMIYEVLNTVERRDLTPEFMEGLSKEFPHHSALKKITRNFLKQ